MASEEIKELCDANHIELDLVQCRVTEIETYMDGADPSRTTAVNDRALRRYYSRRSRYAFCFRRVVQLLQQKFCPFSWVQRMFAKCVISST